jgi:hypothetical protein
MTPDQRREKIATIAKLPAALEAALNGLNEGQLDTPYGDGKWTIRQVVHHLADSHMNAFIRMKLILTEDHPTLKPYNQDSWATLTDTTTLAPESSLSILKGLHARWTTLLGKVTDDQWGRKAHHPETGEVTLESMLTTYANHGEKHVGHILGVRRKMGW